MIAAKTTQINQILTRGNPFLPWAVLMLLMAAHLAQAQTASSLFDRYRAGVFQVRTIDLASGDKSSIGSGFAVDDGALIATNFHVVSLQVHAPETYRLEVISDSGEVLPAELLAIDVVHDLALLSTGERAERSFRLRRSSPDQGERMFSLGNPQDLGMTIIEGNYNGLVNKSRYQKILFSGSLNAGMSGGPAIDARGRLLGINVAKGGEQISFLVPASRLDSMLLKLDRSANDENLEPQTGNFKQQIRDDLYADQASFYRELIEKDWPLDDFGELQLPQKISDSLKCWGHTVEDDDIRYESFHQHCQSNDVIYISDDLYTGQFEFDYEWLSSDELNTFQFYQALENRFDHKLHGNAGDEKDVANYQCLTDMVSIDNSRWKVSSCFRAYKEYADLFDAVLLLASLDRSHEAGLIKASASGISRNSAKALFTKLMESIRWKRQ